jgi:hypothetical protein
VRKQQFQQFATPTQAHTDWVTDLVEIPVRVFSPALQVPDPRAQDFSLILSASMDAKVHMVDVATMNVSHTLEEHAKARPLAAWLKLAVLADVWGVGRELPGVHGILSRVAVGRLRPRRDRVEPVRAQDLLPARRSRQAGDGALSALVCNRG